MLLRSIDFAWRLAATGFAFAAFLGGGLVLAVMAFPLIDLVTRTESRRSERYHALMRLAFQAFLAMLKSLRVIELRVDNVAELQNSRGVIVVANHPTLIDVVLLSALIPRPQCIVKRELWDSAFLGRIVRGSGYIPSDLEPQALLAACREALAQGRSLIVFPEGTRSRPGLPLRFHRGFAHIATLLEVDIQLVFISCDPPTLAKGDRWWQVPRRRPLFRVSPAGWLHPSSWQGEAYRSVAARRVVRRLEGFYNERLAVR